MIRTFDELLTHAATITGKRTAVIAPGNAETFEAIHHALGKLRMAFTLVGDRETITRGLDAHSVAGGAVEIIDEPDVPTALQTCVKLARTGRADILMKGSIDTATMMKAVVQQGSGLKTGRLLSDVFIFEYLERADNTLVMITDGGLTIAPNLAEKAELVINAVEVAHALGNANPKVAILSATEFVLPAMQSTVDAVALAKMNERGQIKGCVVDGPLALDNALSVEAAGEKGIRSAVAGRAEILVAPNIETANSLAKSTTYLAHMRLAHVIVGARVPILIPSRADKSDAKLLSVALGVIMSSHSANQPS